MNLPPSEWMEIAFGASYLVAIYVLVGLMTGRLAASEDPQGLLRRFRDGFLLLALGDTGHVGFRVIALLRGGLDSKVELGGNPVALVGIGSLATAITVTLLYLLLVDIWRLRFAAPKGILYWGLMALGVVRLLLFIPPQNEWGNAMPPWGWSVLRNVPLAVLGVTVAVLMVRDGRRAKDKTFTQLGALILLSYAFYAPVILLVQKVPAIGVLMVPKTLVYLVMAGLVYVRLFKKHGRYEHPEDHGHHAAAT